MPRNMELNGDGNLAPDSAKDHESIVFALHALAVIQVHDSEAAKEKGLTIRDICEKDPYMSSHSESLTSCLFRAFGRHCSPVFLKYLEGVQTTSDLSVNVTAQAKALERQLGI